MTVKVEICADELEINNLPALPPAAGSRIVFTGCVRDHDQGETVTHLEYSAHPQATKFLAAAVQTALHECGNPNVEQILVQHRIGTLQIGQIALLVVVDTAHRAEGFALTSEIVNQIKASVPIWKKQFFADGHFSWSNCP